MAIKKSQLYSTLWESCNALRGTMDASQYKNYVLILLFWKYVSDKAKVDKDFAEYIPDGCSFDDLCLHKNKGCGEYMNMAWKGGFDPEDRAKCIEKGIDPEGLAKSFDIDTTGNNAISFIDESMLGKDYDTVLTKLLGVFEESGLDLASNREGDDDLIGDAYEYLMRHFAAESGKSKGQFYTPAEVSRLMSKLVGIDRETRRKIEIYDPTCGSGSLLLRAKGEATNVRSVKLSGQESDKATLDMARMNFCVHGSFDTKPRHGNVINDPTDHPNTLKVYDYVLANPPFSSNNWVGEKVFEQDRYSRWGANTWAGQAIVPMPPQTQGDFAFLLHIFKSMKPDGKAAVVMPHGVLFRGSVEKNNAEAMIRRELVKKHVISGIIGLPSNLFYGTGIPACLVLLDNNNTFTRKGIFMINASDKRRCKKDGAKNRLREQDIKLILDTWRTYEDGNCDDVPHYAHLSTWQEIERNGYNLNLTRYVPTPSREVRQDLHAHINLPGGLPAKDVEEKFSDYWQICPSLRDTLFATAESGYYNLLPQEKEVRREMEEDKSYRQQLITFGVSRDEFFDYARPLMNSLAQGCKPKSFIDQLSSKLLEIGMKDKSLVQPYELYDLLMIYWNDEMQDDLYLIASQGWETGMPTKPKVMKKSKKDKTVKFEDKTKFAYNEWVCDLLPVEIIISEYFAKEDAEVKRLEEVAAGLEEKMKQMEEANEEGAFDQPYFGSSEKASKKKITCLIKGATARKPMTGEIGILQLFQNLEGKGKVLKTLQDLYVSRYPDIFRDLKNAKGAVTKTAVRDRLIEIELYQPAPCSVQLVWLEYLNLEEQRTQENKTLNELKAKLFDNVYNKYSELTETEVRRLVVNDKWIARLDNRLVTEMERVTNEFVEKVKELHHRYERSLPQIEKTVNDLRSNVIDHLRAMGINVEELCKK